LSVYLQEIHGDTLNIKFNKFFTSPLFKKLRLLNVVKIPHACCKNATGVGKSMWAGPTPEKNKNISCNKKFFHIKSYTLTKEQK
jgi:hypothetical protein